MEDLTTYGILGLAIIGTVSAVKETFPGKVSGILTVVIAVAIGLLAGVSGLQNLTPLAENLTPISGVIVSLATVGLMTLADRMFTRGE